MSRSRRARFRNRGRRKAALITEKKLMWATLACTKKVKEVKKDNMKVSTHWSQHIPIMHSQFGITISGSA